MTRDASRLILLALLGISAIHAVYPIEPTVSNDTATLEDKIRRQLMADNYDYMESETEEPFPARHELDVAISTPPPTPLAIETSAAPLHPRVNDIFIPRAAPLSDYNSDLEPVTDGRGDRGVMKSDLLYYVDDERLKNTEREVVDIPPEEWPASSEATTTPKVSYKVLKVSGAGGGRRAAGGQYKFLQEERGGAGGGVALINLGDQPFPEFRLPSARRMYRAGAGSEPELELAQLTDVSGDLGPPL